MASSSLQSKSGSALDAVRVRNVSASLESGKKVSPAPETREMSPVERESVIFDQAAMRCGFSSDYIARELEVSASTVTKWRSPDYPHLPTLGHVAALGDDFERQMAKCRSRLRGWGQRALLDAVRAIGDLANEVGE